MGLLSRRVGLTRYYLLDLIRLTTLCSTGGCAAKYDGAKLEALLAALPQPSRSDLLVGLDPPDDAAAIRLDGETALLFTVDFFPPIVDDPTHYGRIAANNALNDIYAMGGRPSLALAIAAFPPDLEADDVARIVRGAALQCAEAGAVLAGGHTIRDNEPKFGLAVAGTVAPERIWRKSGAVAGDTVLITKPIGTGLITSGRRRMAVSDEHFRAAVDSMLASSRPVVEILARYAPHAVTDVTGFGLAGHAAEVARASDVRIVIDMAGVPFLDGAQECAQEGVRTSAHTSNRALIGDVLEIDPAVGDAFVALAVDPQTAGGLMIVAPADAAHKLVDELQGAGQLVAQVGHVTEGGGVHLAGRV